MDEAVKLDIVVWDDDENTHELPALDAPLKILVEESPAEAGVWLPVLTGIMHSKVDGKPIPVRIPLTSDALSMLRDPNLKSGPVTKRR